MRKAIAIVALTGFTGLASAGTIANWNFNDQSLPAGGFGWETGDLPQAADVGAGSLSLANWNNSDTAGVFNWLQSFAGTTTLAIGGASSGGSLALQGAADEGITNNGAQVVFAFDGTGALDLGIDFARRGTGTGFTSLMIEMFDNGVSVGVVDTILGAQGSTWTSNSYSLAALDGVANASVVFTFDGATSNSGNNRLDNVTIYAIPTPGTAALLGLGGLVATRRRRA